MKLQTQWDRVSQVGCPEIGVRRWAMSGHDADPSCTARVSSPRSTGRLAGGVQAVRGPKIKGPRFNLFSRC